MNNKISNFATLSFVASVFLLSVISIFSIFSFVGKDVLLKSFESIGIIGGVTFIVIVADYFLTHHSGQIQERDPKWVDIFIKVRKTTLWIGIMFLLAMTTLAILGVWNYVASDLIGKAITSTAIMIFSSVLIVVTSFYQEGNKVVEKYKHLSGGFVLLLLITGVVLFLYIVSFLNTIR